MNSESDPEAERLAAENAKLKAELEAARESSVPAGGSGRRRIRKIVTGILVVLTSLSIVATTAGVWMNRTIWNTDRYVALVAPLAKDPAVTEALAVRLTGEAFQALNVQERVQEALASIPRLPASADGIIAGPLTASAQNLVESQVKDFLASETFANLWIQLNERLHEKIVALLNGDYQQLPNVQINGGEVRLNLVSVVALVLQQVAQSGADALGLNVTVPSIPPDLDASAAIAQLGSSLGVSLPADFGQITIATHDQLIGYQQTAQNLKKLAGALFLLSCLLLVATLIVAPDRRRTVIWLGLGAAVALFLGGVFVRRVESRIVDGIAAPGARAAAKDIFTQVSAGLRHAGLLVLTVAALAALIAYVAGRPPWVLSLIAWTRRVTAPRPQGSELEVWVAAHADPVRIAGGIVALIALFLTGIDWIPVAIVGALLALLLWGVAVSERRVRSLAR
jgi:hypothetical protein